MCYSNNTPIIIISNINKYWKNRQSATALISLYLSLGKYAIPEDILNTIGFTLSGIQGTLQQQLHQLKA